MPEQVRAEPWRDDCRRWQMVSHGAKLSRNMDAAIAALLAQPSVAEAARVIGIRPQTLSRWMKVPEFDAAYRAAQRAVLGRAIARLQQASGSAVTTLLKVMFDADATKAARLAAAEVVLRHAKAANEIEDIQSRLSALARDTEASHGETAGLPANERGSSPIAGHGARLSRKKEEAISQLLTQRSVDEAARVTGVGTQTLYRWIRQPQFEAAYRAARRAAFGQASARLQQASGAAVSTILQILRDPFTPASTRVRAADLALSHGKAAIEEDIVARLSELGYATETAQAILYGDRRSFNVIARKPPKLAA
jgi:transposase-like protein